MHRYRWIYLLIAASALFVMGSGKKSEAMLITFHLEASQEEAPKFATPIKLGPEAKQYYFKKIPEFTDADIAYYYPFVSQDGKSFGAGFKLKSHPSVRLKALSLENSGRLLGSRVAPLSFSAVLIDRPIDDGIIVIWDGLTQEQIKAFGERIPHVEQVQQALGQTGGGQAAN